MTSVFTTVSLVLFLGLGAWIYYNVSYLNDYATEGENDERAAIYEQTLKHYDSLPLPVVTRIQMNADLYPEEQKQFVHGWIGIRNLSGKPIRQMLLDGDHLTDYRLWIDGKPLSYTTPLLWPLGFMNWFKPGKDTAGYRLYTLAQPLEPGDSTVIEVSSELVSRGFQNGHWWRFRVAPNETEGCMDIPEGLAWYDALLMAEQKYGKDNMQWILRQQLRPYLFLHRRQEEGDAPLIRSNHWFTFNGKAALELYALRDLIGEDSIDAALREFRDSFQYRQSGPYAGANDLYHCLRMHTPDSLQYFLTDSWLRNRFYDLRLTGVSLQPTGRPDEYKAVPDVHVGKEYVDEKGVSTPAKGMADYIDVGIFGHGTVNEATGRGRVNPLYLQRCKLTAGEHRITVVLHGKPEWAGIDPYGKLVDLQPNDNIKRF